ncbi:MAG: cytochrome P450 [Novosphingobium sp.]|nr:cytochrome P450 [Novosphingobium sp.]
MSAEALTEFSYDPFSDAAMRDPQPLYREMREQHPAWFIPEYDTFVFTRFEDVWNGYMDRDSFSEAEGMLFTREQLLVHHRGAPPEPVLEPVKSMFLFLDPPVHTRIRQVTAAPFLKGSIARREAEITSLVRERLNMLIPRGEFDLNADFASFVAVNMVCRVLGIEPDDPEALAAAVNLTVAARPDDPRVAEARGMIYGLLVDTVKRRRTGSGPDSPVIDALMHRDTIGRALSDEEIATDLNGILVGGTETLPKIVAGGLLELARHPDQLNEVRAALPDSIEPAFDEMLRYFAPAQWFGRTVKKPVRLGGVDLEPGQRVILIIASANRDQREFDRPDDFIWNRKTRRLLSFGVGPHFCIGIHLARLEGQVMLREFLSAVKDYTVHPERGHWPVSQFQIGWTSLPVSIEQAR